MLELAEMVLAETGSSSPITLLPLARDDTRQRQLDITMAKKHLGWAPNVGVRDGLKPTTAYFQSLLKSE
jgi:UDP-glucuronate decarboxylase